VAIARVFTVNRVSLAVGSLGLALGVPYFVASYLLSKDSLALSEKAYKLGLWKDCHDRAVSN
jgi:hypothetical protein